MPLKLSPTQLAFNPRGNGKFNKPFPEQVDFFRKKLNLPTEYYDDVLKSAHDRAFMVAGAAKADLLGDFRQVIDQAIADGKSIGWFRKEFDTIVDKHGWAYNGERDWRTRVIYTTNIRASYAAGRYAQLNDPDLLSVRPYWKYNHSDTVAHPRELHESWDGTVLHYTHPWWKTHFTPNGYGCQCYITAVRASEYKGHPAPDDGTHQKIDWYGDTHTLPNGVDYGFDYQPGASTDTSLREFVQNKLIRHKSAITRALSKDVNRYINTTADIAGFAEKALADRSLKETTWLGFVENEAAIHAVSGEDVTGYLVLLPSDAINHVDKSHRLDGNGQRPIAADDYTQLQRVLTEGVIAPGVDSATGLKRVVSTMKIGAETFRAVFEIRSGAKNRALVLVSLVIKS